VDLAGVCWQVGLGAALAAVGAGASPTLALAVRFIAISAGWSLLPLIRTDGAWALADAVGLRDIEAPLPEGASPGRRAAAAAVRSCAATAVTAAAVFVSLRLLGAGVYMGSETRTEGLITAAVVVAVSLILVSAVRRAFGLGLAISGDVGPLFQTTQGRQAVPTRPRPTTSAQLLPRLVEAITDAEGLLIPLDSMDLARSAGGWTVAQVLEHVCLTADAYIAKIRPALDDLGKGDPRPEARPMKASLPGRLLAAGVDPRSVRRLPAPGRFRPSPSPRGDIRHHVFRLHTELYGLLRSGALLPLDRKSFGSPVSPLLRVNAWDAFLVLTLHLERHLGQVRRILAH